MVARRHTAALHAYGANYLAPGWFSSACGANYPHQALKGGYFVDHFVMYLYIIYTPLPLPLSCYQVKFLLSTQIQNSPPLVPGAGSLHVR